MADSKSVPARPVYPVAAAAAGIILYFFHFTFVGLLADFTHDDLMNLTGSWRVPLWRHLFEVVFFFLPSETYRPVASVFYRIFFELFGFTPLPFRVACYLVLLANLALAWAIAYRLTKSWQPATLTALIFAYHGQFWTLYMSTGFCYDLLCYFFYAAAFLYYLNGRARGIHLRPGRIAAWCAIYILCLGSKEMAVSLPVVMLAYETLESPPRGWGWLTREARAPLIGGAMTALFVAGRMMGAGALSSMEAYRPVFSLETYLSHAGHWISEALYDPRPHNLAIAVSLLLAAPVVSRSKTLRLSFVWMAVGILPIAFIPQRGIAQAYIPAYALALFAAIAAHDMLARVPGRSAILFGVIPAILFLWHSRYGPLDFAAMNEPGAKIRAVYEQLSLLQPEFPRDGRVLFARDPFPDNDWASTFLVYLYSREHSVQSLPVKEWLKQPDLSERVDFDLVLSYENGNLLQCDERAFQQVAIRDLPRLHCEPIGIAYPAGAGRERIQSHRHEIFGIEYKPSP